jgi:hypothetical protein
MSHFIHQIEDVCEWMFSVTTAIETAALSFTLIN